MQLKKHNVDTTLNKSSVSRFGGVLLEANRQEVKISLAVFLVEIDPKREAAHTVLYSEHRQWSELASLALL